jgi:peptidoglycan/xylan/chitin deacetylase (PgdA/CDA1 family)
MIITGWIIISMVLVAYLVAKNISLERRLTQLERASAGYSENDLSDKNGSANAVMSETEQIQDTEEEKETQEDDTGVIHTLPEITGTDDVENMASDRDVHKVYLTFDNSPSENTAEILDILAEHEVKATFFVVGSDNEEYQELYQRIVDEGHTIGMHSYANKYSVIYQSTEAFAKDYNELHDFLYRVTGVDAVYYRFPGGSSNQVTNISMSNFIHYLNEQGVTYFDWNVSTGDTVEANTAEDIISNVKADVLKYKTSVIQLCDSAEGSTTVEVLGPLIEELQSMDAEILPIDEDTQVIQAVKADSIE